ncbi:MAG: hypothetical protein ACP5IT_06850 [Thermoproteota archaeon]
MNKATLKKFFLNFIGIALLCSPLLLMLPPVQAFTSRMTYYATLPYARIPYALVNINVEATYFNGSTASVRDLTVIWLASPRNDLKSSVIYSGNGKATSITLPRVHISRVSKTNAYGKIEWIDIYNVENLLITIVTYDGCLGTKTIGVELNNVVVNVNVKVEVSQKNRLKNIKGTLEASGLLTAASYYHLVESKESLKTSKFITLYPDKGVTIKLLVPQGKTLWFESISRTAPGYDSLQSTSWSHGNSGVNMPDTCTFDSSIPAPNGGNWVDLGTQVKWRYERWEGYDSNYNLVEVIETIFPSECLGGIAYLSYGAYTPPSASGNLKLIGDGGASRTLSMGGTWTIGGISVSLSFGVSYPTGSVTVGGSFGFSLKYESCSATISVVSNAYDPLKYSVYAFDAGTGWAKLYTAWIKDT